MKVVKRKNPKADKMSKFRKQNQNLPTSPHLALTDRLGTTEHKIRKEIAIMKKCNHPHIVKLLEVIDDNLNEKIYMGTPFRSSYFPPCIRWLYACLRLATRVCPCSPGMGSPDTGHGRFGHGTYRTVLGCNTQG